MKCPIQSEYLNHFIFLSEVFLEHAVGQYVEHCNLERTHQGIGNAVLSGSVTLLNTGLQLIRR